MNNNGLWQYILLVIGVWLLFEFCLLGMFIAAAIPDWLNK